MLGVRKEPQEKVGVHCIRFKMTHTRKDIWKDFVERNSTWVFFLCLLFSFVSLFGTVAVILSEELHALGTAISNREEVSL